MHGWGGRGTRGALERARWARFIRQATPSARDRAQRTTALPREGPHRPTSGAIARANFGGQPM
eukprot:7057613-Prymnesium_polylepis.1